MWRPQHRKGKPLPDKSKATWSSSSDSKTISSSTSSSLSSVSEDDKRTISMIRTLNDMRDQQVKGAGNAM